MLSSQREVGEAERGQDILSEIRFGVVHTSGLIRAQKTAEIIMSRNNVSGKIPVMKDQRLNERHYGDLQGLNKAETAEGNMGQNKYTSGGVRSMFTPEERV